MHTPGAQMLKSVHPAAKMCTGGAACTLNFEHCYAMRTLGISSFTLCQKGYEQEKGE